MANLLGEDDDEIFVTIFKESLLLDYLSGIINWHGFTSSMAQLLSWLSNNISRYAQDLTPATVSFNHLQ
jgi:hypothetical protein